MPVEVQGDVSQSAGTDSTGSGTWIDAEVRGCHFRDKRHETRLRVILAEFGSRPGASIPLAFQDWGSAKAAYRFLDNDRVDESVILEGHFQATGERARRSPGLVLVLHDTTEFTFKRKDMDAVGMTTSCCIGTHKDGRPRLHTVCGLLMHSSLVVTPEGLPLGLAAAKFWSRAKFKGSNALSRKVNRTRVSIEEKESVRWLENLRDSSARVGAPERCVHIGDRESDIYELFCEAHEVGTHFLLRTCVDRLAGDGKHTIANEMEEVRCKGRHRVKVVNRDGKMSKIVLELRYRRIQVLPPIGKQKRYPPLELTILHATERNCPKGRDPIEWKLVTDLPIHSRAEAVEKLDWYALRWRIETYHKILKSGCRSEESQLRTAERIVNLLALNCIIAWRIFWLTMLQRDARRPKPNLVFTDVELRLLERTTASSRKAKRVSTPSLKRCLSQLAILGGYLNRAGDGPPGNTVIWRGLSRLTDIVFGYELGRQTCG
jgi:hypothetical protein